MYKEKQESEPLNNVSFIFLAIWIWCLIFLEVFWFIGSQSRWDEIINKLNTIKTKCGINSNL